MITVLFRDEIDDADLDIATGQLNIRDDADIESLLGAEVMFTITDLKNGIFPFRAGDVGVVEVTNRKRYRFEIATTTPQAPYQGSLTLLSKAAPRNVIYTIGYGNREIGAFIALLKQFDIEFVIDVRSSAYSKYNESFSQKPLQENLQDHGIHYVFMGAQLGGRPKDETCYTDGKVDYEKVEQKDFYQQGINRLEKALSQKLRVALMCSELKPERCHRSKLIGQTLEKKAIDIAHVDENGILRTQLDVVSRLNKGQLSMFEQTFTSRKSYK